MYVYQNDNMYAYHARCLVQDTPAENQTKRTYQITKLICNIRKSKKWFMLQYKYCAYKKPYENYADQSEQKLLVVHGMSTRSFYKE